MRSGMYRNPEIFLLMLKVSLHSFGLALLVRGPSFPGFDTSHLLRRPSLCVKIKFSHWQDSSVGEQPDPAAFLTMLILQPVWLRRPPSQTCCSVCKSRIAKGDLLPAFQHWLSWVWLKDFGPRHPSLPTQLFGCQLQSEPPFPEQEAHHHRAVFGRPSVLTELSLRASYQLVSHRGGPQEEGSEEEPIRDMSRD